MAILALVVLYGLYYRTMVKSLDEDIKSVRGLLLLLPDEVAKNVPAVLDYSRQLMNSQAGTVEEECKNGHGGGKSPTRAKSRQTQFSNSASIASSQD